MDDGCAHCVDVCVGDVLEDVFGGAAVVGQSSRNFLEGFNGAGPADGCVVGECVFGGGFVDGAGCGEGSVWSLASELEERGVDVVVVLVDSAAAWEVADAFVVEAWVSVVVRGDVPLEPLLFYPAASCVFVQCGARPSGFDHGDE